jgi:zinc protease
MHKRVHGTRYTVRGARLAACVIAMSPVFLSAQSKLDRTKQPAAAASPTTRIPTWTKSKLANGAELVVSVKRNLPLVSFTIGFVGGATSYEPAAKAGLASFTAQMLSEGTTSKTAEQFSDAQQMLGISVNANIGAETGTIGFTALKDRLDAAIALAADMMLNPRLPADALERIRGRTVVNIKQGRDQPNTIAVNVFNKVTYGDDHPYGRTMTEQSVAAITRDDIVAFHKNYYQPGRAVISVAGDVDPVAVKASIEKALAAWAPGGSRPDFKYPDPPAARPRAIYLVDKQAAVQSVFRLGMAGPNRYTPDYYALEVMNMILGGLFQSRLNHEIREEKGFSYGVGSAFAYGRGPGSFRASGGIITEKSDSALILFMKHLAGAQGAIPFTDDEIKQGKDALVQSLPETFASVNGVRSAVSGVYLNDLGEKYYNEYAAKVNGVTREDLVRVAKKYIDLEKLNLVIIGDRAKIEESLRKTGIAPIVRLDVDGKPVITP